MLWRTPPTHFLVWNRIAQDVTEARDTNLVETARLFALMDAAINDGLSTSFASKFHYGLWRPVTAIQRAGEDDNPATEADPTWMPLHPSTPPYPSYAGNAATVGAAAATVLAGVFGTDAVPFTVDWSRYGFAGLIRSYDGFWAVADEEAHSREYGGIHFSFDSDAGQQIGADVANYVIGHVLLPASSDSGGELGIEGDDGARDRNVRGGTMISYESARYAPADGTPAEAESRSFFSDASDEEVWD